ncbi:MATE family efflux transporter [Miniphocaeibacter halophilus]|uniref:MATE family efflux transporter n=1 Tax=Miniphocaeibacter halophilus TaxID=2931922 RepID=A0AC61MZX4_9FIRM|nr:MATE family efflux transporter [Miniphocaeibacter halophilus]QQK08411.1 MATE family efflux transporter [Miniphocaeibacter halophilus]
MYKENSFKLFIKYALPQMFGLLLNSVYLIVDGIFIGNRLGRDAMAAAAVSVPVVEFLIAISLAVSSGAGIIISSYLGKDKNEDANKTFNLSILVLGLISIIIVVFGNVFINGIANLLGSTPDIHDQAVTYLWYILTFSPFLLFSFLLSGLARNDNRPKLAMIALVVGSVSNIVLDYVFMYPLNMGIAGAALATALGPIFSVLILLPHFISKKGFLYFTKPIISHLVRKIREIVRMITLGFPAFIMEFTIGIVTFIYNYTIIKNGYGEIGLAAYLVIGYLSLIILTVFLGISQGLQPIFSYFNGREDSKRNKDLISFSIKAVTGIGILIYILVVLFAKPFITIFSPDDIELINFTYDKTLLYFWGFVFAGLNILFISFFQSVRETKSALILSLSRGLIVLPIFNFIFPIFLGANVIWFGHSIAETVTAIFAILFFTKYYKKYFLSVKLHKNKGLSS